MTKKRSLTIVATSSLVVWFIGCSSNQGGGTAADASMGGAVIGGGGAAVAMGGLVIGGAGGSSNILETGGMPNVGGGAAGMGGGLLGSGGVNGAGGATVETGGVQDGTGGVQDGTGGSQGTGVDAMGGFGPATGGSSDAGGAGTGGTTAVDPNVSAAIDACMAQLPWGASDMTAVERAPIVTAIINTCAEFAPPGAQWQTYCQMFLVAAINAESSYNAAAGSVGAGDDPTIGLLQIRFSSTVRDFADNGPVDAMARVGCDFGTVTSSDSYATKSKMMLDVNCNVALGAWYYFIFGSGNGGSNVVWVDQYCRGNGVAGNLHIGMACHLMGGEAAHSSLSGADYYYDEIKSWFEPCVSYTGTHPFELVIQPDRDKYCG
jgi:hypothetical protein